MNPAKQLWNGFPRRELSCRLTPRELLAELERSVYAPDITVYLKDAVGEAIDLRKELASRPEVSRVKYVSKEDALEEIQERLGSQLPSVDVSNPVPAQIRIWLNDLDKRPSLVAELEARPEVSSVALSVDVEHWVGVLKDALQR